LRSQTSGRRWSTLANKLIKAAPVRSGLRHMHRDAEEVDDHDRPRRCVRGAWKARRRTADFRNLPLAGFAPWSREHRLVVWAHYATRQTEGGCDFLTFDCWETEWQQVIFKHGGCSNVRFGGNWLRHPNLYFNQTLTPHPPANPCYALNKMG
jgi:hypothetical protein